MTDPIKLVESINASIDALKIDQKELHASLKTATEAATSDAKAAVTQSETLAKKVADQSEILFDLQQKLAEGVKSGKESPKTLADIILKSEEFTAFVDGKSGRFKYNANTIIGQEGSPAENSDTLVQPDRKPGIVPGAFRRLGILDVLPTGTTNSNMTEYTRELAFTNRAAETNEGVIKPETDITFELVKDPVATIAHFIKASKQILEDAGALRAYIDLRMRYGVELRKENQVISGNGVTPNLSGMLNAGNHTVFTPEAGDKALDSVNRAIQQVALADYEANAIVMNTSDWHNIERAKVGSGDDRYVVGDPLGSISRVLWGLPVVVTNSIAAGTFIAGNMDIAYMWLNRMGTVVEMYEQDDKNVQQNLLTIRAEARGVLQSLRPASVVAGNLVAAPSGV
jgi:HK97 family phage major capsid protein